MPAKNHYNYELRQVQTSKRAAKLDYDFIYCADLQDVLLGRLMLKDAVARLP